MSRRAAVVTQADVARAIRAAKQEGLPVVRIVVTAKGATIEITPDIHKEPEAEAEQEPLEVI